MTTNDKKQEQINKQTSYILYIYILPVRFYCQNNNPDSVKATGYKLVNWYLLEPISSLIQ